MAKKRESKPKPERATVLTIRGTPEWREWLDRAARHFRVSSSALVDIALTTYARENGFGEPPPER